MLCKKKQLLSGLYAAFYAVLPVFIAVSTYTVLMKATSSTIAAETNLLHLCEIVPLLLGTAWICAQRRGELTQEEGAEKQAPADDAQQPAADSSAENPAASVRENSSARASVWESARVTSLVLALVLVWSFYLNSGENALHKKIWMDRKSYYSGSEPLAEYIRENVPKDAVIVATRRGTNTSVAAYLDGDYTLTCLLSHEPLYYTKWCSDWPHPIPRSEWLPDLISLMEEHGELYVIYSDDTEVSSFSVWLWRLIDEGDAQMVYHSNAYGEALTDVPDDYKPIERCETMGLYKITAIDYTPPSAPPSVRGALRTNTHW